MTRGTAEEGGQILTVAVADWYTGKYAGNQIAISPPEGGDPLAEFDVPVGGSYIFAADGTAWAAQTLSIQFLLPGGNTWVTAKNLAGQNATLTAPGAIPVVIGDNARIKVVASAPINALNWALT